MFAYTVACEFTDPAVAEEWLQWLREEHLADVLGAGASAAEVVRLDGSPVRIEVRYRFHSRAAFEVYERDHAPRLRAEGLRRFPLERGLTYTRSTGEIVTALPRACGPRGPAPLLLCAPSTGGRMGKGWALVTGASSGIGEVIARRLAERGHPVALVARRRERLEKLAASLPTESLVIAQDLGAPGAAARVMEALGTRELEIVVNNAGFGAFEAYESIPPGRITEMLNLNVVALAELCRLALPGMLARRRGHLLNIASIAAYFQVPGLSIYGATKAFVLSFSLALDAEVRHRGVSVTAVCPGPVETEFNVAGNIDLANSPIFTLTADQCADFALRAMDARRAYAVPHLVMKVGAFLSRFLPRQLAPRITYFFMRHNGLALKAKLEPRS